MKVDAPRGDDPRSRVRRAERQRQPRHRHRMRIVSMHDLWSPLTNDARQLPRGRQVDFVARRKRNRDRVPRMRADRAHPRRARRAPPDVPGREARGRSGGPGFVRRARCGRCRCGGRTQLPELRELEADVIRVHCRDDQASHAVAKSAAQDVVAKERQPRASSECRSSPRAGRLRTSGAPPASYSDPSSATDARGRDTRNAAARLGACRRVRRRELIRGRSARPTARGGDRRGAAGSRDTSRSIESSARDETSRAGCGSPAAVMGSASIRRISSRQRRRHAFVGVERQNPVVGGLLGGEVLLRDVAGPRPDDHADRCIAARSRRCRRCFPNRRR